VPRNVLAPIHSRAAWTPPLRLLKHAQMEPADEALAPAAAAVSAAAGAPPPPLLFTFGAGVGGGLATGGSAPFVFGAGVGASVTQTAAASTARSAQPFAFTAPAAGSPPVASWAALSSAAPAPPAASSASVEPSSCAVCEARPRAVVFTGCGHAVTCAPCAEELLRREQPCPVCRAPIKAGGWSATAVDAHGALLAPFASFQPDAVDPSVRADAEVAAWKTRFSSTLDAAVAAAEASKPDVTCGVDIALSESPLLPMLTLHVAGATPEPLSFPLGEDGVDALRAAAARAPFGRGADTVVDTAVRDAWQIDSSRVSMQPAAVWQSLVLDELLLEVIPTFGIDAASGVEARLYKLVIYEEGGHFALHCDTEKELGMLATLVVQLPVAGGHGGGELCVRHEGVEFTFSTAHAADTCFSGIAFYADCEHELRRITAGRRVCLVYSLVATTPVCEVVTGAAQQSAEMRALADVVAAWPALPARVGAPLDHKYTRANLAFAKLKARDRARAAALRALRDDTTGAPMLQLSLALVERCLTGDDEYSFYSDRVRTIAWVGTDDARLPGGGFGQLELGPRGRDGAGRRGAGDNSGHVHDTRGAAVELLGAKFKWPNDRSASPDARRREPYTGNEGPTVEYVYYRTMLVVAPRRAAEEAALGHTMLTAVALAASRAASGDADAGDTLSRVVDAAVQHMEDERAAAATRESWRGRPDTLAGATIALPVLAAAARVGAAALPAACKTLHAMGAVAGGCGVTDATVPALAALCAAMPPRGADAVDGDSPTAALDASLVRLVRAALERGELLPCAALARSLAARDDAQRAMLVASTIVEHAAAAAAAAEAAEAALATPMRDLAALVMAREIAVARAQLARAPAATAAETPSYGDEGEDQWAGSSHDGSD
jgi:hypothetical protein